MGDKEDKHQDDEVIVIEEDKEEPQENQKTRVEESPPLPLKPRKNKFVFLIIGILIIVVFLLAYLFLKPAKKQTIVKKPAKVEIKKKKNEKVQVKPKIYNSSIDVHFINAIRLEQNGKFNAAINELEHATSNIYMSYYNIGLIFLKLGDIKSAKSFLFDKTVDYLLFSIENNPNYADAYFNLFRVYMMNKQYNKAKQVIMTLKQKNISSYKIKLMEVYYDYITKTNYNNMYNNLKNLITKRPNNVLLNNMLGCINLANGNVKSAYNNFNKAISEYSDDSAYYNLALLDINNRNYAAALNYLSKSSFIDFDKIPQKNYLESLLYMRAGNIDKSLYYARLNKHKAKLSKHIFIKPYLVSGDTLESFIDKNHIPYLVAAEILNMYLKPIKLTMKLNNNMEMGNVYKSLGLFLKAESEYKTSADKAKAVLLSQRAIKLYLQGRLKQSLRYYLSALNVEKNNPILMYNAAIMQLKNHNLKSAKRLFISLNNKYREFPMPYLGLSIVHQLELDNEDSMIAMQNFVSRIKIHNLQEKFMDLYVMSNVILRGKYSQEHFKQLTSSEKFVVLNIKAAVDKDLNFLNLSEDIKRYLHMPMDTSSYETILKYFNKYYGTEHTQRMLADFYFIRGEPNKAYKAMYNMQNYTGLDYYKLGLGYLLAGFDNAADNFLTKSILKSSDYYEPYFAKAVIQIKKHNVEGMKYYLKLAKGKLHYDTNIKLSYDIELR